MATVIDNFTGFYGAESALSSYSPTSLTGRSIYKFNSAKDARVPLHIRTGQQAFGDPTERKRFSQLEFHGKGTCYVRIYVDGVWIADGIVTMTESPDKMRRFGIPTGTRGYTLDVEFCGDADIRAVECTYSSMSSPS